MQRAVAQALTPLLALVLAASKLLQSVKVKPRKPFTVQAGQLNLQGV